MVNWNTKSYTEQQLRDAWGSASSISEVLSLLGLRQSGASHKLIKSLGEELGLRDLSLDYGDRRKRPLSEVLVENSTYLNSHNLKMRLFSEGVLVRRCSATYCPFNEVAPVDPFTGEPATLTLTLDHINGVRNDNRIDNLRILCYHCHSMTKTWGNRKR